MSFLLDEPWLLFLTVGILLFTSSAVDYRLALPVRPAELTISRNTPLDVAVCVINYRRGSEPGYFVLRTYRHLFIENTACSRYSLPVQRPILNRAPSSRVGK
jgi:hypothetical protein